MAKIQAKKIAAAIKKAQKVGEVEEPCDIAGCSVVLRSLTNPEYVSAVAALDGLEDIEYAVAFRVEHLCRSICEINGESLRDVAFVEVEEEDPITGKVETVTLERHQFIRDYVLSTWSREAIDTASRKFRDVEAKAEQVATRNIHFDTPDETAEEMYRRLLAEAKEIESSVPFELATKIRDEFGYLLKQEWASVEEKMSRLVEGDTPEGPEKAPEASRVTHEVPELAASTHGAPVQVEPVRPAPQVDTSTILRRPPQAPSQPPQPAPVARPASAPLAPPMGPPVAINPALMNKSAEIQALEEGLDAEPVVPAVPPTEAIPSPEAPEPAVLDRRPVARDPVEAQKILDQPPVGGINPRFKRPPTRW